MNTPPLQQSVTGSALKAMRTGAGISLRKLAIALNCSHQHLHAIEAGKRPLTAEMRTRAAQYVADHLNGFAA